MPTFSSDRCLSRDPCHGTGLFGLTFGSFTGIWSCFVFVLGNYPVTHPNRSRVRNHRTFGGLWHTSHQGKWPRILHWYRERNVTPCRATFRQFVSLFQNLRKELKLLVLMLDHQTVGARTAPEFFFFFFFFFFFPCIAGCIRLPELLPAPFSFRWNLALSENR